MSKNPFAERLLANETIVWSGRPRQGLVLTWRDLLLIPFGLTWGGFAIFWEAMVLTAPRAPIFMKLFGVPFVFVGLFLVFGRLPFDAWLRARIHYALTDRRILISREGAWPSFQALPLGRLADLTLTEASDGRGTIRFAPTASIWSANGRGWSVWVPTLDPVPQFLGVVDARRLFALIQEAIAESAKPPRAGAGR